MYMDLVTRAEREKLNKENMWVKIEEVSALRSTLMELREKTDSLACENHEHKIEVLEADFRFILNLWLKILIFF
jgi:hypothetical protein